MRLFVLIIATIISTLAQAQRPRLIVVDSTGQPSIDTNRWMPQYAKNVLASMKLSYYKNDCLKKCPASNVLRTI
ncbi:hypothetical protein ABDK00_003075 [Niabella insulamsoli]|uniref:hypothetical protein n=1 Tax=Niabella insulamsoli TaxID=3144874 RepID=UPI0031FDA90E